jgi:hypothetical protein
LVYIQSESRYINKKSGRTRTNKTNSSTYSSFINSLKCS